MSVPIYCRDRAECDIDSTASSSTSPPSHAIVVVLVVAGIVRVWLSRVMELGELTDASQCRDIAENGLDVTLIC